MVNLVNWTNKSNKYGDIHIISFLSAALARLAYFDDNNFLTKYNSIMGPVIHPKILKGINNVDQSNLPALLDDQKIFGLDKSQNDIFKNFEYQYNDKNYIDFINLNMPQNINIINGDLKGEVNFKITGEPTPINTVKYISIGWSNYGEIYVVADKRMPNTLFLLFRGTYSAKTASLYSKPTSLVPLTVCKNSQGTPEQFLYGIFKPTTEMIHTIIETMRYLATDFLGATQPNSVKIFTTGHSLGGAMCTNFAYLWMGIKKTSPYNDAPYNVLANNIICVSLGAPRCMNTTVAKKFCNFVSQKNILFLRITTRGDPVTGLPPKTGYQHPCSDDDKMRMEISEDCNAQLTMRPTPNINYLGDLDCANHKTRPYIPNALSHTVYLDILFTKAVDILKFFKGIGIAQEVSRNSEGGTVCRLIMGQNSNYSAIFFDVNKSRETPTNIDSQIDTELSADTKTTVGQIYGGQIYGGQIYGGGFFDFLSSKPKQTPVQQPVLNQQPVQQPVPKSSIKTSLNKFVPKIGGPISEDRRMTKEAYNLLIQQMEPLQGNLCPQKGKVSNPFNTQIMPDLSCPGAKFGGKYIGKHKNKTKKRVHKHKKNTYRRKKITKKYRK